MSVSEYGSAKQGMPRRLGGILGPVAAIGAPILLWLALTGGRLAALPLLTAASGLEASYHVLWTIKALLASSPEAHGWLPTVTLAPDSALSPHWGSTIATPEGARIYTSFPPLGFLLPMLALGPGASMAGLFLFNSVFGLIAALLAGALGGAVFAHVAGARAEARDGAGRGFWIVFAAVSTSYLLLSEMLQSHGVVYWPHSPAQTPLLLGLILTFRRLRGLGGRAETVLLLACCAVYPALEWTGFVFDGGLALTFALSAALAAAPAGAGQGRIALRALREMFRGLPLAILAVAALMLVVFVGHFALVIGLDPFLDASATRAARRSSTLVHLAPMPLAYLLSFGLLAPLAVWAWLKSRDALHHGALGLLFLAALFPMVENALLAQHAWNFSFDRMKLVAPMLVAVCAWLGAMAPEERRRTALAALAAVVVSNVALHGWRWIEHRPWVFALHANQKVIERAMQDPQAECALWGQNLSVRGASNLLLGRDLLEHQSPQTLGAEATRRGACAGAYVYTRVMYSDLREVMAVMFVGPEGEVARIYMPDWLTSTDNAAGPTPPVPAGG